MSCTCCGYPALSDGRDTCAFCDGTCFGARCPALARYERGFHGDRLQAALAAEVAAGAKSAWQAIGEMAIDDARMTVLLALRMREGRGHAWITRSPARWEVYAARRSWAGQAVELEGAIAHALMRFLGRRATSDQLNEVKVELDGLMIALWTGREPKLHLAVEIAGEVITEDSITVNVMEVVEGWGEPASGPAQVTPPAAAGPWVSRGKIEA